MKAQEIWHTRNHLKGFCGEDIIKDCFYRVAAFFVLLLLAVTILLLASCANNNDDDDREEGAPEAWEWDIWMHESLGGIGDRRLQQIVIPGSHDAGMNEDDFANNLLQEEHVAVVPGLRIGMIGFSF